MREAIAGVALAGSVALATSGGDGRFLTGSVGEGVARREYRLYVPGSYDAARPAPLVVLLHGCTQDPDDLARGTRMNEVAERAGFLVLYPTQPVTANGLKCWNWFDPAHQRRGAGEPALVETMTRQVMREWRVDARRVHVAGISAGGAMALVVAAAYPELYASVASHSGIAVGAATDVTEATRAMRAGAGDAARLEARLRAALVGAAPRPLLVIHGTADPVVASANARAAAAGWAAVAGAREQPAVAFVAMDGSERTTETTRFVRQDGGVAVELVLVEGLAHAWSGGSSTGTYADPRPPDASRMVAAFFARHPMPESGR